MKLKFLFICTFIFLLTSCNQDKSKKTESPLAEKEVKEFTISSRCYSYSMNKDTIYLKVTNLKDSLVEGNLTYNLFEKDRNQGNFEGKWHGDSLFADYEFESEGKSSTREIFFLKTESGLIEGYGPLKDTLNKVIFQEHSTLILNENILLKPVDCY
ncbi:hypothetical protein [Christiangramia sp. SM2212]|uniref:Uncharacterized protein n=1 Tax=Christiangramia sediminicola TaxID=3073267 RepID=A0ABU1ENU3_9FLAO|nr:hypothetical protein [Christiangramia sp. SM2212]MDR5590060.1 hypothetical protein [Christiangramia sp. SM2212]